MEQKLQPAGQKKEIQFIVWLRAFSVILILLCHICQTHSHGLVVSMSQIFNVGVNIFVLISGFLFGLAGVHKPYLHWYGKRLKRIFIPYWLFFGILAVITAVAGLGFPMPEWVVFPLGVHGFRFFLRIAEHTWFITAILLCYLATPLIAYLTRKVPEHYHWVVCLLLLIIPLPLVYATNFVIYLTVFFFAIAYILGRHWSKVRITNGRAVIAMIVAVGALALRFGCRLLFDGTVYYDRIASTYTQYLIAFAAMYLFAWLLERKPWKAVRFINDVSFEIYLWHYLFLWSPLSLMKLTPWWGVNVVAAMVVTFIVAWIMNRLAGLIEKLLKGKKV